MRYTPLREGWTFFLWGQEPETVCLPHDFSIHGPRRPDAPSTDDGGYFREGFAYYRRTLPPLPERAYLWLDGIQGIGEVYVNDRRAALHTCPYTGFAVDLAPYALPGQENRLEIRVSTLGQPASRWYTGGGLCREAGLYTGGSVVHAPVGFYVRTRTATETQATLCIEAPVLAREACTAEWTLSVLAPDGSCAAQQTLTLALAAGESTLHASLIVERPERWQVDNPALYTVKSRLCVGGEADETAVRTGIRTVRADPEKGLLLNGAAVKLHGGCVHHDLGPLGACAWPDAEKRRIRRMKEAGFDAIRTSHNPPSTAFLNACDELGMLVIDEIFDVWQMGKKPMDGHLFFDAYGLETVRETVRRDRNHPSVILWSDGNEIPEKAYPGRGYDIEKRLVEEIRRLDDRPVTQGMCCFALEEEEGALPVTRQDELLDVIGYNYAHDRIAQDREKHPARLIALTETLPRKAKPSWDAVMQNACAVGDFVWTAWDYFGESGIGHHAYDVETTRGLMPWPWHIANCGDFDICANRKPQSFLREIVWEKRTDPYVTSEDPAYFTRRLAMSAWGFPPVRADWSWHGQEGKMTRVRVYAVADEVRLYCNDALIASGAPDGQAEAVFELPYQPGKLEAVSFRDGKEWGRMALHTAGAAAALTIERVEEGDELIFVSLYLTDQAGVLVQGDDRLVEATAQGAQIIAMGSGNPAGTEDYTSSRHTTYLGRVLIVLRRAQKGRIHLEAHASGLAESVRYTFG